jgi:NAD kinase
MAAVSPSMGSHFRSALVSDDSLLEFLVNDHSSRKVSAFVDGIEYRNIKYAKALVDRGMEIRLLFNLRLPLAEKVYRRQFPE